MEFQKIKMEETGNSVTFSEENFNALIEMLLDMQDEVTRFNILREIYMKDKDLESFYLSDEISMAIFGKKSVKSDETQA